MKYLGKNYLKVYVWRYKTMEEYLRFKNYETEEEEQELIRAKRKKINKGMYYIYNDIDELEEEQEETYY